LLVAAGPPVAVTTAPVAWGWRLAGVVALAAVTLSSAWTWRRRLA
jgi:hypothetical protein